MNSDSLLNRSPLHRHLEQELKARLGRRCVGFRLPSEKELAHELKVSIPTLRKALSALEEERLIEQGEGRGWKVTPLAKDPRVAILNDLDLAVRGVSPFQITQVQTAKQQIEAAGHPVALYLGDAVSGATPPTELSCRQFLMDLDEGRFSGVLAIWAYPHRSWTDALKARGIPLVGVGQLHETMVSYDVHAMLASAIHLLKQRGRRRIAFLGGISQWNLGGHDRRRAEQVRKLFADAGLEVEEQWIRQDWHPTLPAAAWSSLREIWTGKKVRPDGLIVAAPRLWQGAKEALDSLQLRFPEHLDVVVCRTSPTPLSGTGGAIEYVFDPAAMISEATSMLLTLMKGEPLSRPRRYIDAWSVHHPEPEAVPSEVDPAIHSHLLPALF